MASLDAFAVLGYEPTCKPRFEARERGDAVIPEPCGQCPQELFHAATEDDVLYGGAAGGGKGGRCPDRAAPSYDVSMETKVLTPKGFKLIGDVAIGDAVCNPDGTTAKVIGVFDNGPKQFYRVTLADGSSVEADEDHLWAVSIAGARKRRKLAAPEIPAGLRPEDEWNLRVQSRCRIVRTPELRDLVQRAASENDRGLRPHYVQLPLANPVALTGVQTRWPVFSPYILGALVGDGSMADNAVTISGVDEEIFARIRAELPDGLELRAVHENADRCPAFRFTRTDGSASGPPEAQAAFAAELARLRGAAGLGQRELAARCGVTQSYISSIERCRAWPTRDWVARMDDALGAGGALAGRHVLRAAESASTLLKRDGLAGTHSWDKFIPQRIKLAPVAERFAFVQGLMDTDGSMDARGHVSYTTVSERLATDMQDVLRSLGYRATLGRRRTGYRDGDGEHHEGRPGFALYVQGRHMDRLFHLTRKRERVRQFNGGDVEPWHRVTSVEPTEVDNSRCIQVDNLNHLYVTDDFIVTHNTVALVMEGIRACARYAGLRALILRRTYDELAESVYPEFERYDWARALGGSFNKTEKELTFPNKSVIRLRYMETLEDASRRQGGAYQLLLVDERGLLAPGIVDVISLERLRSAHGVPVIGIRSASNPGGPSHGELVDQYIEPTKHGTKVVTSDKGLTRRFISAKATDNPHLDAAYFRRLDSIPDPARRAAMRDGDWNQFAGMMFKQYRWDRHTLDPITLPMEWTRYNGVDWGFAAPWATLFAAEDPDKRVWVYRELYETQVGESDQAKRILAAAEDGERIAMRYADDAMFATRGEAKSIARVYQDNGVHLTPAGKGPGSRITGWQRWHSYLAEGPACFLHRAMGFETCPWIHIFRTCTNLISELKSLPYARTGNPEDSDPAAADHALDAGRYLLVNLGGGAEAWLAWAKRKAAEAAALTGGTAAPPELPAPDPQAITAAGEDPAPVAEVVPEPDPATLLREARNAAHKAGQGSWQ